MCALFAVFLGFDRFNRGDKEGAAVGFCLRACMICARSCTCMLVFFITRHCCRGGYTLPEDADALHNRYCCVWCKVTLGICLPQKVYARRVTTGRRICEPVYPGDRQDYCHCCGLLLLVLVIKWRNFFLCFCLRQERPPAVDADSDRLKRLEADSRRWQEACARTDTEVCVSYCLDSASTCLQIVYHTRYICYIYIHVCVLRTTKAKFVFVWQGAAPTDLTLATDNCAPLCQL